MIDEAWALKDGKAVLLALDWAKAFDSVSPDAMARALKRFGVPEPFVDMIRAIYTARKFLVRDAGSTSGWHPQHYGICQGCPLSPFLFVLVMTVLLHDAKEKVATQSDDSVAVLPELLVRDLVYADDTLIVDVESSGAQSFMEAIGEAGMEYGLSFNWSKLEALPVRMQAAIFKEDGALVQTKDSIIYLGSMLSSDGRIGPELGRRIGLAQCDFKSLQRVWSHSQLSQAQKLRIFDACVVAKLVYGIFTATLNQAERRRIDGFHARCLRRIIRVPPAYVSRVSNASVMKMSGQRLRLSQQILHQQMIYMGQIARRDCEDPVRDAVFLPATIELRPLPGPRRRGRPRTEWAKTVHDACLRAAGSPQLLRDFFKPGPVAERAWKAAVRSQGMQL